MLGYGKLPAKILCKRSRRRLVGIGWIRKSSLKKSRGLADSLRGRALAVQAWHPFSPRTYDGRKETALEICSLTST